MSDDIVMYCVYAMESVKKMNGNRGKFGAMAGHAFLHAYWDAVDTKKPDMSVDMAYSYKDSGMSKKVCLRVETVEELKLLEESYRDTCGVSLVTDRGLTVFEEPTTVCLGIGPIRKSCVKEDLSSLKVLI